MNSRQQGTEGKTKSNNMKKILFFVIMVFALTSCEMKKSGSAFGIDISQYNGNIDWAKVKTQEKTKDPIEFVVLRSTVGTDVDTRYKKNYKEAKKQGFIVGSYHYYRPNENSTLQFENFKKTVKLERGDIIPVVDIEVASTVQSMESLKVGVRNFVTLIEKEYGVKPIIYTGLSMWDTYLKDMFGEYKLWISAYSLSRRGNETVKNADIHQFTSKIRNIPGIPSKYVDGDDARDLSSIIY